MWNLLNPALLHPLGREAGALMGLGCAIVFVMGLFALAVLAFVIYCWWRIFTKAGYNGAMALLILIPGIGALIVLGILAFGEWPSLKQRP